MSAPLIAEVCIATTVRISFTIGFGVVPEEWRPHFFCAIFYFAFTGLRIANNRGNLHLTLTATHNNHK